MPEEKDLQQQQEQQEEQKKLPIEKKGPVKHLVKSTNLEWVSYDKDKKELTVQFKSGGLYKYDKVPEKVFDDLLKAGSKGRFFWMKIRDVYKYTKLN